MFPSAHHIWRMHMPATPQPRKGRGAGTNESGRFETEKRVPFDDGWGSSEDEPARLETTLSVDATRTIIARNDSPDIGFDRSINPYRGCEHGCIYCYARPSHAYLGLSPGLDFETRIFYKPNAAALLRDELRKKGYVCRPIALGSNTDPYQPAERKLGVTRSILKRLRMCCRWWRSAMVERSTILRGRNAWSAAALMPRCWRRASTARAGSSAIRRARRICSIRAASTRRRKRAISSRCSDKVPRSGGTPAKTGGGERRGQRKAARSARCRSDLPRLCRSLA